MDAVTGRALRPGGLPLVPDKLTGNTALELALLNIHTVSGLNSIQPFDLQHELAENKAQVDAALKNWAEVIGATSVEYLQEIGVFIVRYEREFHKLPPLQDAAALQTALSRYGSSPPSPTPYVMPYTKAPYKLNATLSGKALASIAHPEQAVVLYEPEAADDGTRGVLFADAQARRIPEATWPQLQQQSMAAAKPKVVTLTGAAALYYIYKQHQQARAGQSQYYLDKVGHVYYRDTTTHQAHWVTPPPGGIQVPVLEAYLYRDFQGYNNSVTGRTLDGVTP